MPTRDKIYVITAPVYLHEKLDKVLEEHNNASSARYTKF